MGPTGLDYGARCAALAAHPWTSRHSYASAALQHHKNAPAGQGHHQDASQRCRRRRSVYHQRRLSPRAHCQKRQFRISGQDSRVPEDPVQPNQGEGKNAGAGRPREALTFPAHRDASTKFDREADKMNSKLKFALAFGILGVSTLGNGAAASAAPPANACSLLTPAQVSAVLGVKVGAGTSFPVTANFATGALLPFWLKEQRRRESCSRFKIRWRLPTPKCPLATGSSRFLSAVSAMTQFTEPLPDIRQS